MPFPSDIAALVAQRLPLFRARIYAAQYDPEMEAAQLADEEAGYLDLADEPSPSVMEFEAEAAPERRAA